MSSFTGPQLAELSAMFAEFVTFDGLGVAQRAMRDRIAGGDFLKLPGTYTATVTDPGDDELSVLHDAEIDPTAAPIPVRSLVGHVMAGDRVQVQYDPKTGRNFVIGRVPDSQAFQRGGVDPDGWTNLLTSTDASLNTGVGTLENTHVRRFGDLCIGFATVVLGVANFTQGTANSHWLLNLPYVVPDDVDGGEEWLILGDGFARNTTALGYQRFAIHAVGASWQQAYMRLDSDGSLVGPGNPWAWQPAHQVSVRLLYPVSPDA